MAAAGHPMSTGLQRAQSTQRNTADSPVLSPAAFPGVANALGASDGARSTHPRVVRVVRENTIKFTRFFCRFSATFHPFLPRFAAMMLGDGGLPRRGGD